MNLICKWLVAAVLTITAMIVASAPAWAADEKSDKKETKDSARPVVAVIRLNAPIVETPVTETISFGETHHPHSLKDITARLAKARDDQAVKAVVILLEQASIGTAQAEELRQAIAEVTKSGKDVYAHADGLNSIKDYAMLSPATHLGVVPTGDLWLTGLYGESMYLRGLLKKLGVTPDFLTCGDYKSAAETFMREGPSPKAEEMQNWLLDSMFNTQVKLIAQGRGVETDKVKKWIDGGPYTAQKAKDLGIIDAVEQRQDMEGRLKARFGDHVKFDHKYGEKAGSHPDLSSTMGIFEFYGELLGGKKKKTYKTSVAIVYVDGAITLGEAESNPFSGVNESASSSNLRRALDEAAADDTIKAVVLRVNSPGGSATASDIILDATRRVKAKKPLVVSMGDVAASGGYYVSCASDTVYADEGTITGSIGVVGGKLATTDMWNKVGITFKGYKRGKNADILSSSHTFTKEEREHVQGWMDEIYDVFKGHVTASRGKKLKKPIDELAGGRVYSGKQALELGLVDKIGTLDDAVKFAATEAKLDKYELRVVPEPKGFLEMLLDGSTEDHTSDKRLGGRSLAQESPLLQAALPLLQKLDPERLAAVRMALLRLDLLQREGAVLMAPEIIVRSK